MENALAYTTDYINCNEYYKFECVNVPSISGKQIRFEETPIVVPTGTNAMSAAEAAYASGLLTLHSSLRLDEEQSKLFDTFIKKKYKKLHDK